ncbi:PKD domain-containing protein [Planctomonas deserti]|uniref:PKD domain-containing protein n=1 Tax=Planctomonas deserti TaxID=2144185 RepID=UPI00131F3D3A|nr:PKD domain-containing protein [Planctomonas deserti]
MRSRRAIIAAVAAIALLPGWAASAAASAENPGYPSDRTVHFTAAGDYSTSSDAEAVLRSIASLDPDLHIALGDLSYGAPGAEPAWCDLVTGIVGDDLPFELLAGNHESDGRNGFIDEFAKCLPNRLPGMEGTYARQYYVDVPAENPLVRYVMISPGIYYPDGQWSYAAGTPRYDWTERAIDGARESDIPWVVVGMHNPCLSVGRYGCAAGPDIMNLLVEKRVDLVLGGHEHIYQRTHQLALADGCARIVQGSFDPDCVADGDSTMDKGDGTVFTTVGTGGVGLRDVYPADAEARYHAAWSGMNATPTHGVLDVTVSESELSARFVRASGGTFSDGFVLRAEDEESTPPPPAPEPVNAAPTAAFSASCPLLSCSFNASSSRDSDGSIRSYDWTFGDGTTATGPSVAHVFPRGDHRVSLRVTDDDGATATTSRTMNVPTRATATIAADDFARTTATGWGTADAGGTWTTDSDTRFSTAGTEGVVLTPPGRSPDAYLSNAFAPQAMLTSSVTVPSVASGSRLYVSTSPKFVPGTGGYWAKLRVAPGEATTVQLVRTGATGAETALGTPVPVATAPLRGGEQVQVRVEATGSAPTTVRTRAWLSGTVEPGWLQTAQDATTGLQGSGTTAVGTYLTGGAPAALDVRFQDLLTRVP